LESLVGHNGKCLDDLRTKTLGTFSQDYRLCKLYLVPCGKTSMGHIVHPEKF
jgi:hypothetical protein